KVGLFEKRDRISAASRASTLHPPTLELLDALGVLAEVQHLGTVAGSIQHRSPDGVMAEFDLLDSSEETRFPYRLHLEQAHVTPVLLDRLRAFPHASVSFGAEVVDVGQHPEGVIATVCTEGETKSVRARYLIAADGAR